MRGRTRLALLVMLPLAGCARGVMSAPDGEAGDDLDPGDAPAGTDGPRAVDAAIDAFENPQHADAALDAAIDGPAAPAGTSLLLTEVVLAPNAGEFIEITNPTNQTVALTGYYLTDAGDYWKLPAGGTVTSSDFIVKFPAGASIGAHAVITVALDTAAMFQATYGVAPTYSIASGTMTLVSGAAATLTNAGEVVALFFWDGQTDLVKDVDILLAGVPAVNNALVDKSGMAQDGPDSGTTTTAYATDVRTILNQTGAPGAGVSTKRILGETAHEQQAGTGNGLLGDDETSEDTRATWDSTFSAPTPGSVPATLP